MSPWCGRTEGEDISGTHKWETIVKTKSTVFLLRPEGGARLRSGRVYDRGDHRGP